MYEQIGSVIVVIGGRWHFDNRGATTHINGIPIKRTIGGVHTDRIDVHGSQYRRRTIGPSRTGISTITSTTASIITIIVITIVVVIRHNTLIDLFRSFQQGLTCGCWKYAIEIVVVVVVVVGSSCGGGGQMQCSRGGGGGGGGYE